MKRVRVDSIMTPSTTKALLRSVVTELMINYAIERNQTRTCPRKASTKSPSSMPS